MAGKRWKELRRRMTASPKARFKERYCVCGKRSFGKNEAHRWLAASQERWGRKRGYVYECPRSFDYHVSFKDNSQ